MSWKYEVKVYGKARFYQNCETFAVQEKAEKAGHNKFFNCYSIGKFPVVEVDSAEFVRNNKCPRGH